MRIPRESLASMALAVCLVEACGSRSDDIGRTGPVDRATDSGVHSAGGSDAGATGSTSSPGGGSSGATSSGGAPGAGGHFDLPPTPTSCPTGIPGAPNGDRLPPSAFDSSMFGCHDSRVLAPSDWIAPQELPYCPNTSGGCTYAPSAIPCGRCDYPGLACSVFAYAPCNCGQGPYLDIYWDGWVCKCEGGQWDCRVTVPSGSSCFLECAVDSGVP